MKTTAQFIELSSINRTIANTVKKQVAWQGVFDNLKVGDIFEAEFGVGGKTMDFKIDYIVIDSDSLELSKTVTFYMVNIPKKNL